jgi:hypothetical protein
LLTEFLAFNVSTLPGNPARFERLRDMDHASSATTEERCFLRRRQAAEYLQGKYGFGATATLAKGVVTGDSPRYYKAGRVVLYSREALDEWALAKIGPARRSSSEEEAVA